jgi:hypothetical protein
VYCDRSYRENEGRVYRLAVLSRVFFLFLNSPGCLRCLRGRACCGFIWETACATSEGFLAELLHQLELTQSFGWTKSLGAYIRHRRLARIETCLTPTVRSTVSAINTGTEGRRRISSVSIGRTKQSV